MTATFLKRKIGIPGALVMGLGSMVGTGVFVSIGLAAGVAGPTVLPAILLGAFVALCNGISSAQLASAHPVSGGTYEYGYRWLSPQLGFTAGWMFLCAKSASAATAALGFGGYLLHAVTPNPPVPIVIPALGILLVMVVLIRGGMHRTHRVNAVIVSVTLLSLVLFIISAGPGYFIAEHLYFSVSDLASPNFFHACALMFVAFTGYGRIATMGEEIRNPKRTVPLAILAVVFVTAFLYLAVAMTAVGAVGADELGRLTRQQAAPLESVLNTLREPTMARIVTLGALTAMLGVLLNLLLGLSRVLLAMSRRGDMPAIFARIRDDSPRTAVVGAGILIALIALPGQVMLSWSFSAFTVLVYYAITNLAALRLPPQNRLYPRVFSCCGLGACAFLAFQVEPKVWIFGLGLIGVGLLGQRVLNPLKNRVLFH